MESTERTYGNAGSYGSSRGYGDAASPEGDVNVGSMERWGSVALGTTFAWLALRRGGPTGALLMLSAGGLLLRGLTGHCHAYGALGIDTTEGREGWSPERSGEERSGEERFGQRAGTEGQTYAEPAGHEGPGPAQVRSFELHASEEGIRGSGTDRTEPHPQG